jgi:hypothetical protein
MNTNKNSMCREWKKKDCHKSTELSAQREERSGKTEEEVEKPEQATTQSFLI